MRADQQPSAASQSTGRSQRRRHAFTLIEVMVVLMILGVLLGLVLGFARHAKDVGAKARALADLGEIHHAVARYYAAHEIYPDPGTTDAEPLSKFWLETPDWAPEEMSQTMITNRWTLRYYLPVHFTGVDPWGAEYHYQHDAENAPLHVRLYSLGPTNPDDLRPEARLFFQP